MVFQTQQKPVNEEVSPIEDLMREHGVLQRILLIYKQVIVQLKANLLYPNPVVLQSAHKASEIMQKFIDEYHQHLEEQYVFPVLSGQEDLKPLIDTLFKQHHAASCLTEHILYLSRGKGALQKGALIYNLWAMIQMYEPHAAREDTVVFPAFHKLLSPMELDALGEKFEAIEEQKFGKNGFETVVEEVAQIEKALGIWDIAQFTAPCVPIKSKS